MQDETHKKSAVAQKEENILKFWKENKIFEKSLEKNSKEKPFVFYDGPPFATGLPHYGHLLAGTIKDSIPRFQTMRGKHVRRVWGWDCHGLPLETQIEDELGLHTKQDIESFGVDTFNDAAKKAVLRYRDEWMETIPRMGRWVDMENDYRTMDASYTESVWWAFRKLHEKGLLYKGRKSMHLSPLLGTGLSNFEVSQNYKDITDISVYVKFELVHEPKTYLLAWTTTPWTLPGNVALAVRKDATYCKVKGKADDTKLKEGEMYILAKERLSLLKDLEYEIVEECKGESLAGKEYRPIFDYYASRKDLSDRENGWKVYEADFVTMDDGTGIVHIAPAFGEDDMKLGEEKKLPFVQHVGMDGKIKEELEGFAGLSAKPKDDPTATDVEIIKNLAHRNLLFAKEKITHSYPHCWRTDAPLLNYAMESWFVKATALKDELLSENKKIKWIPKEVGEYRFGHWLENVRDWSISRTRFWGAPLPVWMDSEGKESVVVGSVEDIKKHTKTSGNKYFVMRHGEAESNVLNVVSSKVGNPHHLTDKGKQQVVSVTEDLKKHEIDLIVSSDFVRTKETAKVVAGILGIPETDIVYDERLREVDTGDFDGKPVEEYHKHFTSLAEKFTKRPPHGETALDIKRRVTSVLYDMEKKYAGKRILFVSHEYPIWMLLSGAGGMTKTQSVAFYEKRGDPFFKNAEYTEIDFVPLPHNEDYELDLHRPFIDEVTLISESGRELSRIPDVFDCWFESGSMPYGQFHYPFENSQMFDRNFPADFIAEGQDQTRGWFYSLLVLGTALFGEAPYKSVIVNGMILAEDGRKMSKKLKNYPDPMYVISQYGADSLRMYLLSSPVVHAEDLRFSEKGVDEVYKKIVMRIQNVLSFYQMYGRDVKEAPRAQESSHVLDAWIMARYGELLREVTEATEAYELDRAVRPFFLFVDDLSTWYIRRSRERFKSENLEERAEAVRAVRLVLLRLSVVLAPFAPFLAEDLYQTLHGTEESVHLEKWPEDAIREEDGALQILKDMSVARGIVSLALEARAKSGVKVRQPLATLHVKDEILKKKPEIVELVKDEVNVKSVVFDPALSDEVSLDMELTDELRREGDFRELLRSLQEMRKKLSLLPSDHVILRIASNESAEEIVSDFKDDLVKSAGIEKIEYEDLGFGGEVKSIGEREFEIKLIKAAEG